MYQNETSHTVKQLSKKASILSDWRSPHVQKMKLFEQKIQFSVKLYGN